MTGLSRRRSRVRVTSLPLFATARARCARLAFLADPGAPQPAAGSRTRYRSARRPDSAGRMPGTSARSKRRTCPFFSHFDSPRHPPLKRSSFPEPTTDDRAELPSATLPCCHERLRARPSLGGRLWGQVLGFSGRLKVFQGNGVVSAETTRIAGNALYQARFPITQPQAEASMVSRGRWLESVRGL